MHELHPSLLWLGHAFDVRGPRPLFDAGITAVVDVAFEEPPAQLPRQLLYLRFPLNDGGGNDSATLRLAVQSLVDLLHTDTRTIVACSAGMSRSPTIAAYALACHLNIAPELALERIAAIKSLEVKGELWSDVASVFSSVRRPTWCLR
ncbi:protein-tyrosine phosphatase family protein [Rhodopirellula baltica]